MSRSKPDDKKRTGVALGKGDAPSSVRVAIYLRISTDEEHQPFSLDAQRHRLLSFIPTQPGWVHVETYEDQMSGAKAERPDLSRAMRDARVGRFDVLLVYRVDRFARSLKVLVQLLEELEEAGVAFRSATEPIDTSSATGRMLVQLLGVFAEFERATIIDRVINGMERKAATGAWLGGKLPHGLSTDAEKRLAIEPSEFPIVQRIFERYADGRLGAVTLAAELNGAGHRTRWGKPWSAKVILDMIRNRSYLGEIYFRGTWYKSADNPFVDPALFDRAQQLIDERGEGYEKRFTNRPSDYALTGLMVCDRCKGKYVGASATGKRHRYRYYICSTRQRYGLTGCDAERIRADELETAVFAALVQLYAAPDLLSEVMTAHRKGAAARTRQHQKELTALDAELRKTEAATERYMLAFENGTVTEEMFGDRVHELGATARTLRAHRAELHAAVDPANTGIPTAAEIDVVRQQLATAAEHASAPVRKALAHAFVHELRVEARNRVRPTYKLCRGLPATNTHAAGHGGGVRTMKPVAVPTGFEPVSPP